MPVTRTVSIPLAEVELRVSRSSGPGGQHANVTASRVEAAFDVEESTALSDTQKRRVIARAGPSLTAVAQDTRSQARNRELALERLRDRLAAALGVPRKRRPTERPARERRPKSAGSRRSGAPPSAKRSARRPPPAQSYVRSALGALAGAAAAARVPTQRAVLAALKLAVQPADRQLCSAASIGNVVRLRGWIPQSRTRPAVVQVGDAELAEQRCVAA